MADRKLEIEFKRWVRKQWEACGWWASAVEFASGGDEGYADLTLMVPADGALVPVELKRAGLYSKPKPGLNGLFVEALRSDEIRPSQVIWHRDLWAAGGESYFLWGIERAWEGGWDMYGACGKYISDWRNGLIIGDDPSATVRKIGGMDELLQMIDGQFVW